MNFAQQSKKILMIIILEIKRLIIEDVFKYMKLLLSI